MVKVISGRQTWVADPLPQVGRKQLSSSNWVNEIFPSNRTTLRCKLSRRWLPWLQTPPRELYKAATQAVSVYIRSLIVLQFVSWQFSIASWVQLYWDSIIIVSLKWRHKAIVVNIDRVVRRRVGYYIVWNILTSLNALICWCRRLERKYRSSAAATCCLCHPQSQASHTPVYHLVFGGTVASSWIYRETS